MDKARVTVYLVTTKDDMGYPDFSTVAASLDDAREQVLAHVWPKGSTSCRVSLDVSITPFILDVDVPQQPKTPGVYITGYGINKISVIKVVREITGMGLKESKDPVESASPMNPVRITSGYGVGRDWIVSELFGAGVPQQDIIVVKG